MLPGLFRASFSPANVPIKYKTGFMLFIFDRVSYRFTVKYGGLCFAELFL